MRPEDSTPIKHVSRPEPPSYSIVPEHLVCVEDSEVSAAKRAEILGRSSLGMKVHLHGFASDQNVLDTGRQRHISCTSNNVHLQQAGDRFSIYDLVLILQLCSHCTARIESKNISYNIPATCTHIRLRVHRHASSQAGQACLAEADLPICTQAWAHQRTGTLHSGSQL